MLLYQYEIYDYITREHIQLSSVGKIIIKDFSKKCRIKPQTARNLIQLFYLYNIKNLDIILLSIHILHSAKDIIAHYYFNMNYNLKDISKA
ncbi:hypothetical protein Avbf_05284 [Armadillidium vulgare]|nr:hypothetical protein Avbf_05284 [Armadillidium vulgare]